MTRPAPTTASLHREMVEALRAGARRIDIDDGEPGCACCGAIPGRCSSDCPGEAARAALEGWEKRPRLRDQQELRDVLSNVFGHDNRGLPTARIDEALDALEPLLFGERG